MKSPSEDQAIPQVTQRLTELLELAPDEVRVVREASPRPDAVAYVGDNAFVVEWKASGDAAAVAAAVEQVRRFASELQSDLDGHAIPVVAVPFMGPVGRRRCEQEDISWLDLSGNAEIVAPGIRVRIEGKPNQYKRRGRPSSAFAPKSARVARWLLMHPQRQVIQRVLSQETGVDEGFTSRIVSKLEEDELIVRDESGAIRARDPDLILEAWREGYDFSKHRIHRGHVAARSGDALLRRVAAELDARDEQYAATGLAAAWLLTKFAAFRVTAVYMEQEPDPGFREQLGFREEERGANLWLVVPNDEGVFHGATRRDEVCCVHPVQAYVDLKDQPERADEAAAELRSELLTWSNDG